MRRSDLVDSAELFESALRDATRTGDWCAPVNGLDWTCWEVVDHLVTVLLVFAMRVASRARTEVPLPRSRDRQRSATELVDLVGAAAKLLDCALADLPEAVRVLHPTGMADRDGYVAMGCDELLVHGHDIAATFGVAFPVPDDLAEHVWRRLFPWAPAGHGGWETLLWANGRVPLGDLAPAADTWVWHSAPLTEWDGRVPVWDPVRQRVSD